MSAPRVARRGDPLGGLPGRLPENERILWQGRPDWRVLARRALHLRVAAIWLALMLAWFAVAQWNSGQPARAVAGFAVLAAFGGVALGLLALTAFLLARSTVYTLTERRLVLRFGVAMTLSINLPLAVIDGAALRLFRDGSGDIPLRLRPGRQRLGYVVLWPHARPWRLSQPEPMLRAVPDAVRVSRLLADALAATVAVPAATVAATAPDADRDASSLPAAVPASPVSRPVAAARTAARVPVADGAAA
ncbi:MAG: PH domain-containing protein [Gluconacetobacter diazotrophicus]|nr:PH domain-containing protein [Gluconacetobacter diazotrophicus]